jgi:transposase-like protein
MVLEHRPEHASQWEAMRPIAGKIGCSTEALRKWVRQFEIDSDQCGGVSREEQARVKELEREVRELRRAKRPAAASSSARPRWRAARRDRAVWKENHSVYGARKAGLQLKLKLGPRGLPRPRGPRAPLRGFLVDAPPVVAEDQGLTVEHRVEPQFGRPRGHPKAGAVFEGLDASNFAKTLGSICKAARLGARLHPGNSPRMPTPLGALGHR